jgi:hypothetical protein
MPPKAIKKKGGMVALLYFLKPLSTYANPNGTLAIIHDF